MRIGHIYYIYALQISYSLGKNQENVSGTSLYINARVYHINPPDFTEYCSLCKIRVFNFQDLIIILFLFKKNI